MLRCLKFEREMHDCFGFEQQQLILGLNDCNNGILNEKVASDSLPNVMIRTNVLHVASWLYNLVHTPYFQFHLFSARMK